MAYVWSIAHQFFELTGNIGIKPFSSNRALPVLGEKCVSVILQHIFINRKWKPICECVNKTFRKPTGNIQKWYLLWKIIRTAKERINCTVSCPRSAVGGYMLPLDSTLTVVHCICCVRIELFMHFYIVILKACDQVQHRHLILLYLTKNSIINISIISYKFDVTVL